MPRLFSLLFLAAMVMAALGNVLLETQFDLSASQELPDGYKSSDAVGVFLDNENLLWLRYHHILVSDHPASIPMRLAFFAFSDLDHWGKFQDETLAVGHVLYDHFWNGARKILWEEKEVAKFPDRGETRTLEKPGGFVWQFKFGIDNDKHDEWDRYFKSQLAGVLRVLEADNDFLEGHFYSATSFRGDDQYMFLLEFREASALTKTVYGNRVFRSFVEGSSKYLSSYHTLILGPPVAGETGGENALYWQARGNKPADAEL